MSFSFASSRFLNKINHCIFLIRLQRAEMLMDLLHQNVWGKCVMRRDNNNPRLPELRQTLGRDKRTRHRTAPIKCTHNDIG